MALWRAILTLVAVVALFSCAPKAPPAPQTPAKPAPGSKLVTPAEEVFAALDCAQKPLPFLIVEKNTLTPNPAKAGAELQHNLVYAFCPKAAGQADTGTLNPVPVLQGQARVFRRDQGVFRDPGPDGRGRLPVRARRGEPGTYVYAVEYVSDAEARTRKAARVLSFEDTIELVLEK
jgi:hypothetical protein